MNRKYLLISFLMLMLTFTSCSYHANYNISSLKKGINIDETIELMEEGDFGLELIDDEYENELYNVKEIENSEVLIVNRIYTPKLGYDEVYYILAFEDNKLIYWGLPYEFANHPEMKIKEIGKFASEIIVKNYAEPEGVYED